MLSRRNFLAGVSALPFLARASARPRGLGAVPAGKTQIGGFDTNGTSFAFINFMKMANGQNPVSTFAFPGVLDANGYPNNSGATLATSINCIVTLPAVYGTGDYVLKWTGDGAFQFSSASNMTITAHSADCSILGSGSGVIAAISSSSASSPRVVFHFAGGTPSAGFTATFRSGQPYTNMANLVLCRADQEPGVAPGIPSNAIFNPDFLALMRALNPKTLRLMNWCSVDALMSQFAYRAPTAAMSYRISRWQPEAWAGVVGNTGDAYSCSAPSGWGGLVEGAIVQGQFTNSNSANLLSVTAMANNGSGAIRATMASTASLTTNQRVGFTSTGGIGSGGGVYTITVIDSTHIDLVGSTFSINNTGTISATTLNVGGSGDKLLSGVNGATTGAGISAITANTCSTCIFDSVRDAWVYWPHGMSDASENGQIPIEMQVALCNTLGFNLWTNFPFEYTDASVTALATYVRDNLSTGLNCYYEYSNEVWNFVDTGTPKAWIRGNQFGFTGLTDEMYYGLRVRQIMGNIKTVYGARTNYRRVMACQAFGNVSTVKSIRFNGSTLVTGNAKYNAFTGSTSYNASPNRPIDFCDTLAYATYFAGGVLNNGVYTAAGTYTGMTGAADDYASGDPTRMASALTWVDNDLRTGTSTISGSANTVQTLQVLNSTGNLGSGAIGVYPSWEAAAASYDGARPSGIANLTIENYEGGDESTAPTTAQCTTIGISTTYGGTTGTVNVLLTAYKNSSLFQQLVIDQYTQMQAASPAPRVTTPSWFALQGASKWSQLTGDTYTGPTSLGPLFTGVPFKSWDATVAFNH